MEFTTQQAGNEKRMDFEAIAEAANADDPAALFFGIQLSLGAFGIASVSDENARAFAERGAELGDPLCTAYYAIFNFMGIGGPEDKEKGRALLEEVTNQLEEAARDNQPYALLLLGQKHLLDLGPDSKEDFAKAFSYFRAAADLGEVVSQSYMASCYLNGLGIEKDPKQGLKWHKQAAANGYAVSQYALGNIYGGTDEGLPHNAVEAGRWWQEAADQGHLDAQVALARWHTQDNEAGKASPEHAIDWYSRAADEGHEEAQVLLGDLYNNPEKSAVYDPDEAVRVWTLAAEGGSQIAMEKLAGFYLGGTKDREPSYKDAALWLERIAERGDETAQIALGRLYSSTKEGVPTDRERAIYWLKPLADRGDADAQTWLVRIYMGEIGGGEPSYPEAVAVYKQLAGLGYKKAVRMIVELCSTGKYGVRDTKLADKYRRLLEEDDLVKSVTKNIMQNAGRDRRNLLYNRGGGLAPPPAQPSSTSTALPGLGAPLQPTTPVFTPQIKPKSGPRS